MVRRAIDPTALAAMADEFLKIASPSYAELAKRLKTPTGSNIFNPQSFKSPKPTIRTAPPPPGSVTTISGSSIPKNVAGSNLGRVRSPSTPNYLNQKVLVPPTASAARTPQVTPGAATTGQGRAPSVQTAAAPKSGA